MTVLEELEREARQQELQIKNGTTPMNHDDCQYILGKLTGLIHIAQVVGEVDVLYRLMQIRGYFFTWRDENKGVCCGRCKRNQ